MTQAGISVFKYVIKILIPAYAIIGSLIGISNYNTESQEENRISSLENQSIWSQFYSNYVFPIVDMISRPLLNLYWWAETFFYLSLLSWFLWIMSLLVLFCSCLKRLFIREHADGKCKSAGSTTNYYFNAPIQINNYICNHSDVNLQRKTKARGKQC